MCKSAAFYFTKLQNYKIIKATCIQYAYAVALKPQKRSDRKGGIINEQRQDRDNP